jgi:hypothetical protein
MSEPPPFRAEAIEHHRRRRGSGAVLRVAPRWTRWAFWALVAVAVAALLVTALVRVDRERFVPATIAGAEVRAVLPPGIDVKTGDAVRLVPGVQGAKAVDARIVSVGRPGEGGGVPVTARAVRPVAARAGVLRVRDGSRSLLMDLVPGHAS